MTDDERLDREFAFTPWYGSCRDLYDLGTVCRRPLGHPGDHAAGWGVGRRRW